MCVRKALRLALPVFLCGLTLFANSKSFALSLQQVVRESLKENPEVQVKIKTYIVARERIRESKAGFLPTIDLQTGYGYEETNSPTTRDRGEKSVELNKKNATFSVRQVLFDGFATKHDVKQQFAKAQAVYFDLQNTLDEISFAVTDAYLSVLRFHELVALSHNNTLVHQKTHDQIKLRSDSGVASMADLSQISGRLALAKSNVTAADGNLADARAKYKKVVGVLPEDDLVFPEPPDEFMPATMDDAIELGVTSSPKIKSAEFDILAAKANYRNVRSAYMPQVDVEVNKSWQKDINGIRGKNNAATAMLNLRYNLFNGGADHSRKRQSVDMISVSKDLKDKAHREIMEDVVLAWNALQTANSQMPFLTNYAAASAATLNSYSKQFSLGKRTLLDVLDTENENFQANSLLINTKYDQLFTKYRILYAIGRLTAVHEFKSGVTPLEE